MEVCKFVDNQYPDINSVNNVINYIINIDKTRGCVDAVSTCVNNCINEMYLVKKYFNKLDGQNLIHIIVWSPEFEYMKDTELKHLAFQLTSYFSSRYQAVFGVHFEGFGGSSNTHIHIVVNTVSFIDGYKISMGYDSKAAFKKFVHEVIKEYKKYKLWVLG